MFAGDLTRTPRAARHMGQDQRMYKDRGAAENAGGRQEGWESARLEDSEGLSAPSKTIELSKDWEIAGFLNEVLPSGFEAFQVISYMQLATPGFELSASQPVTRTSKFLECKTKKGDRRPSG